MLLQHVTSGKAVQERGVFQCGLTQLSGQGRLAEPVLHTDVERYRMLTGLCTWHVAGTHRRAPAVGPVVAAAKLHPSLPPSA